MQKGQKTSLSFIVSQNVYEGFIQTFRDRNPLHTDAAYAINKGYKSVVMHGNILNGFLSYFIGECLPTKDVVIHSQQISYNLPVYLGDTLEFEAELIEIYDSVNAYEFKFQFINAENQRVAKGKIQIGLT